MFQESKELSTTTVKHPCFAEWDDTIDGAELRGYFTDDEKDKAENWEFCLAGAAHAYYGQAKIKYNEGNGIPFPDDSELWIYGRRFYIAVEHNDFVEVHLNRKLIEQRVKELIR